MRRICALLLILGLAGAETTAAERFREPPATLPRYTIKRVNQGIEIDGVVDEADWERTAPIYLVSPWSDPHKDGRQGTVVRMLWDAGNLYISYVCDDPYLDARVEARDGPVHEEDSVGVLVAPGEDVRSYFGYEMNIYGVLRDYLASGGGEEETRKINPAWQSEGVRIAATYRGTLNDHADVDQGWSLEVAIPFANFRHLDGRLPPRSGDRWRLNLVRTAGYQGKYSIWSDTRTPDPVFHRAAYFGKVRFSSELVKKSCGCQKRRVKGLLE